jgi:hypothetical protein
MSAAVSPRRSSVRIISQRVLIGRPLRVLPTGGLGLFARNRAELSGRCFCSCLASNSSRSSLTTDKFRLLDSRFPRGLLGDLTGKVRAQPAEIAVE